MLFRSFALALTVFLLWGGVGARAGDNILTKNNGLGAAAAGTVGLTLGAMALAPPPTWEGYPKSLGERHFVGDAAAAPINSCAVSDANSIAKALLTSPPPPPAVPLHLADSKGPADTKAFDEKAIYDSGQTPLCLQPQR